MLLIRPQPKGIGEFYQYHQHYIYAEGNQDLSEGLKRIKLSKVPASSNQKNYTWNHNYILTYIIKRIKEAKFKMKATIWWVQVHKKAAHWNLSILKNLVLSLGHDKWNWSHVEDYLYAWGETHHNLIDVNIYFLCFYTLFLTPLSQTQSEIWQDGTFINQWMFIVHGLVLFEYWNGKLNIHT